MIEIEYHDNFLKRLEKIRDGLLKEIVVKQVRKILENPEIGKPMRYSRQGTRELYAAPFRLSYAYRKNENKITVLDLYHKDEQ